MTLDTQTPSQSSPAYSTQTQAWKWEKKHWLLGIAVGCLALWFFASQVKEAAWMTSLTNCLPLIGSLAFAGETMLKLAQ